MLANVGVDMVTYPVDVDYVMINVVAFCVVDIIVVVVFDIGSYLGDCSRGVPWRRTNEQVENEYK